MAMRMDISCQEEDFHIFSNYNCCRHIATNMVLNSNSDISIQQLNDLHKIYTVSLLYCPYLRPLLHNKRALSTPLC